VIRLSGDRSHTILSDEGNKGESNEIQDAICCGPGFAHRVRPVPAGNGTEHLAIHHHHDTRFNAGSDAEHHHDYSVSGIFVGGQTTQTTDTTTKYKHGGEKVKQSDTITTTDAAPGAQTSQTTDTTTKYKHGHEKMKQTDTTTTTNAPPVQEMQQENTRTTNTTNATTTNTTTRQQQ